MNSKTRKLLQRVMIAGLILGTVIALYFLFLRDYISIEYIKVHRDRLHALVDIHYIQSVLLYIGTYILITALVLPGAITLSLLGGFLFGIWPGILYLVIGATVGACVTFVFVRYVFGDYVQKRFGARLAPFNESVQQHGGLFLFVIRLMPIVPFWLANLLAPLTVISFSTFLVTTFFGIIPGGIVYLYAGKSLGSIDSVRDLMTAKIMLPFGLLIVVSAVLYVFSRYLSKRFMSQRSR